MNPITTAAATCSRLGPLASPNCSPRTSPWQSPIMAYKFGQTLTIPGNESQRSGGRRGSHDKRELFAYPDETSKNDEGKTKRKKQKNIRFDINKHAKNKAGDQSANPNLNHHHGEQKKKKLKDVALEIKSKDGKSCSSETPKKKNKKNCVLM